MIIQSFGDAAIFQGHVLIRLEVMKLLFSLKYANYESAQPDWRFAPEKTIIIHLAYLDSDVLKF